MKNYIKIVAVLFLAVCCSSCLEMGLEDLETYEGDEITSIQGVYYRYYTTDKIEASGEYEVKQISMSVSNSVQNVDAGTWSFNVTTPTNLPSSEQGKVNADNLVVVVNLSTAAVIEPIGDAPKLGLPGNWSKSNQYKVTAANGKSKTWTLNLNFN